MSHFLPNFIFRYTTIPVKEIQAQKIPLTKNKGDIIMQIPLICTTTIEIPLILEIQRTRRVYLYEEEEQPDIEVITCRTSRNETGRSNIVWQIPEKFGMDLAVTLSGYR